VEVRLFGAAIRLGIMEVMKRLLFLLSCSAALLFSADLSAVHSVYIFTMSKGLDQYLANRLTNTHVLQVVTDPKTAEAFFTDQIGPGFQSKMQDMFPPPEPEKTAADEEKDAQKPDDKLRNPLLAIAVNKVPNMALNSTFGRGKGTVFLVDAKTREVIWSTFEVPKDFTSKELDRTASDIVSRLKKDLNPSKK
jgi:hypothetical protein